MSFLIMFFFQDICPVVTLVGHMVALDLPGGSDVKESVCNARETQIGSLGLEDPLEKGMATHSSIPTWEIPWTEEPGRI